MGVNGAAGDSVVRAYTLCKATLVVAYLVKSLGRVVRYGKYPTVPTARLDCFFNWPFNIYSVPIPVTDNTLSLHVDHIIFVLLFFVQYIFSAVRVQVFCLLKISIPDSSAWTKSFVFDISGNTWFSVICAFWSRQHHICAENRFPTSQSPTIPFFFMCVWLILMHLFCECVYVRVEIQDIDNTIVISYCKCL